MFSLRGDCEQEQFSQGFGSLARGTVCGNITLTATRNIRKHGNVLLRAAIFLRQITFFGYLPCRNTGVVR